MLQTQTALKSKMHSGPNVHDGSMQEAFMASQQLHAFCCPFDLIWLTFSPLSQTT